MKLFDRTHPDAQLPRIPARPGHRTVIYYHVMLPNKFRARHIKDGHDEPSAPEGWIKATN